MRKGITINFGCLSFGDEAVFTHGIQGGPGASRVRPFLFIKELEHEQRDLKK